MNEVPNSDVMAEAERWFARLKAPDCTASERLEFQRWRALSENASAYAATERVWYSSGKLAGRPDLEHLSQQILADVAELPRRLWYRMAIAASVVMSLFGGGFLLTVEHRETPPIVYATEPGERSTLKLADGSQVDLNFATELDVRFDKIARRITLRKGEALFTVARDGQRPFTVAAADGEVTALGTRFQVRNDARQVAITLLEGRVAVYRPMQSKRIQLQPGEQVTFTEAKPHIRHRRVDPVVAASWVTGRLLFRSTPLAEALEEVNRYSATQIRLADQSLANLPISGTFEIGDSASVASALQVVLPVQVVTQSDREVLLLRR